ncbi:hypothetical protein SUGI_1120180 [Cryptomeria japonica]|uniref:probable disease resistance protein At1g61300 n=1 Tax=Cryptomeria japonica TaxID=3369 RepID=UPI002414B08E|nr:probable disease resistance protein At1g61300 [Cryptomeria japonica]GLJ52631.1 hypothetical protein SUGI_1120180 [Cryptomeria japonica]
MASSSSSFTVFKRETPAVCKKIYDAFISHRGPDAKATVAFALYEALEEKGYWTFLDEQELQFGDSITSAIQDAIYSSKVQIAIFSPRYAESSWCLDELVDMLKTKALFIPVFYDVKPSELRYLDKGCYAAAFAEHNKKKRFSKDKIDKWKAALESSADKSGYEFSTSNGNVERVCTEIALAVQQEAGKTFKGVEKHQKSLYADEAALTSTSAMVKKSSLLPRDSHPVGIDTRVKDMVGLLKDPKDQVIAVVGMGGLGKTFLLQNVYKAIKSKYEHSIWLSISKSYSLKNLQHDIASQIGLESKIVDAKVTEERATELIHNHLEGKRSLIVLDDLWTLSAENSLLDKLGLPIDKDCKVVVTTRNRQVALNSGAQIYEMKNLSDEDSWRLFCIYAFPRSVGNRAPPHLEEEGQKIVKQCGNLPLAIKTIAASLANTTLLSKWKLKRRQLERVAIPIGDLDPVMEILKLSYDSLPAYLKPCFTYLSFFPEDEEIIPEYLINLWIGEGLVPGGEDQLDMDQWDLAWDWFDQLAQLCLLQICEEYYHDTMITRYCKIHDLLHDLAIQIAKEDKCVFSVEEVSKPTSGATGWGRILLAKKGLHDLAISDTSRPVYLRTLSLSRNRETTSIQDKLFSSMRGLRVLDLSWTKISTLPTSLGKMVLLRVLNLTETEINEVPQCVKHLKSLLFLALPRYCMSLPAWISELRYLQHLHCTCVRPMPKGISKLASLKTLRTYFFDLSTEEDEFMRLDDFVNMTQLQEVQLLVRHEMECKKTEEGILAQLVEMRHLKILNEGTEFLQFSEKMRAMKHLERLSLWKFIMPSWIHELANLRVLDLNNFECNEFPELQAMPNLVALKIEGNESCRKLPKAFGKSGGFPQLRFLHLAQLYSLKELPELEDGAMPCLQQLYIVEIYLKKVEGLERLKRLELFDYWLSIPKHESWETLKEGGEYWKKIKAINPRVHIEI